MTADNRNLHACRGGPPGGRRKTAANYGQFADRPPMRLPAMLKKRDIALRFVPPR